MQSHQMKRAAGNSAPTDPNFKQTVLLLHGDGTNGGQNNTFIDSSTNNFTITRNGNTTQGTFSPFSQSDGYWSNYFDGTGDYLSIADNAALDMGSSDFTIEGWYYPVGNAAVSTGIVSKRANSSTVGGVLLYYGSTGLTPSLLVDTGGTWGINTASSVSFNGNAWNHFAIVRNGTAFNLYINGVSGVSATSSATIPDNASSFTIGSAGGADFPISTCYMSNFRVVKGTAVYTGAFTPPTAPLTAITNTSLLTCQSNRFKDNSSNAFAITRNGDTAVTAFSSFAPTAAYVASTNGGSGYFDGTGDYLDIANSNTFDTDSTYTLEAWFYQPSAGNATFFGRGGGAGSWSTSNGHQILLFIESGSIYLQFNTSGSPTSISTTSPAAGQWNHAAVGYDGTTTRFWLNGASVGSSTAAYTMPTTRNIVRIGAGPSGGNLINGYIGNVRFVKGTDVYGVSNTSITVPTSPLTAITNTALLTSFTNAAIFDNTGKNDLETVGNAQISTSVVKYGTGSMYFDGTGDYIFSPSSSNFSLGSGDFTIECWFYAGKTGDHYLFDMRTQSDIYTYLDNTSLNYIAAKVGSSSQVNAGTYTSNSWTHYAIVRSGSATNNVSFYVNGTRTQQVTDTTNFSTNTPFFIGRRYTDFSGAFGYMNGYIDDLRITKGVARYTGASFTVPARAFPDK